MLLLRGGKVEDKSYISFKCTICGKQFILLMDEIRKAQEEGTYLTCPFNGRHKSIIVTGRYDDMLECMEKQNIYKRDKGRIKQVK